LNPKKIAITGGPGTGKSSLINALKREGFSCYDEISRQVTLHARQDGIEQLFITEPLLFSKLLLEGRTQQFLKASELDEQTVFLDRGIPDVLAYMDFIGDAYPQHFIDACTNYKYDTAFVLAPWEAIFVSDSERYESFDQAKDIHLHLLKTYKRFGYELIEVPFGSIENRVNFIREVLSL
jgi:predicted ATPase